MPNKCFHSNPATSRGPEATRLVEGKSILGPASTDPRVKARVAL